MKPRDFIIPICDALGEAAAVADMKKADREQAELSFDPNDTTFSNPAWEAAYLRGYERGKRKARWR